MSISEQKKDRDGKKASAVARFNNYEVKYDEQVTRPNYTKRNN